MVYKLKEEHAKGRKKKEKKEKHRTEREKKNCIDYQRTRSLCQLWAFNIREGEPFYYTKVNLVLYTHALQIILFGPIYVRTQYRVGSLQIVSLQIVYNLREFLQVKVNIILSNIYIYIYIYIYEMGSSYT